jgi:alanine racemase
MGNWLRPTWVEIDLKAVQHNVRRVKAFVGLGVCLVPVLKADALGHGLMSVSAVLIRHGVDTIGVGDLAEAVTLRRRFGRSLSILLLPSVCFASSPDDIALMRRRRIMPTLCDISAAKHFATQCSLRAPYPVFVKVDTGYMRAGVRWEECARLCEWLKKDGRLALQGLYTHMADPKDETFSREQYARFLQAVESVQALGMAVPLRCVASTAVVLQYPDMHLNCIDSGRLFYGIRYLPDSRIDLKLRPAFKCFKTRIIQKKPVRAGESIGYGRPCRMERDGVLGLIPVGWSHGYPTAMANKGAALVRGERVPVVGSVSTEHATIDLTGRDGVEVGEEVVLIGRQGHGEISLAEISAISKISIIELTTAIGRSVPRVYLGK